MAATTPIKVDEFRFLVYHNKAAVVEFILQLETSLLVESKEVTPEGEEYLYKCVDCKVPLFGLFDLYQTTQIYIRDCYQYFIDEIEQMFSPGSLRKERLPNKLYSIMGTPGIGNNTTDTYYTYTRNILCY